MQEIPVRAGAPAPGSFHGRDCLCRKPSLRNLELHKPGSPDSTTRTRALIDGPPAHYPASGCAGEIFHTAQENSDELQAFEASRVVVSVWDIIDHFLNGPSEEKGIRKIEGDRQKVFRQIDDKSEDVADRIFNCKNNRYFMSGKNSSDENILNPDDLMKRIIYIDAPKEIGTGFYVDDNLVMTNFHVIDGSLETHGLPVVRVDKFGKTDEFGGMVVAYDRWRDLALLSVEEAETPFPIYIGEIPNRGAMVSTFGNPRGIRWIYTRGVVSGYSEFGDDISNGVSVVITDAAFNRGASGGPLVYAGRRSAVSLL